MQLELLQYYIKFLPGQLKSVRGNEAKWFCFGLTLWNSSKVKVSKSGIKWYISMVSVSMVVMQKVWLKSVMSNVKVFAT